MDIVSLNDMSSQEVFPAARSTGKVALGALRRLVHEALDGLDVLDPFIGVQSAPGNRVSQSRPLERGAPRIASHYYDFVENRYWRRATANDRKQVRTRNLTIRA